MARMFIPDVPVSGEIRLGQFIKLANLVETGGMAKELIAEGAVRVNGVVDTRRGKVLRPGDEVTIVEQIAAGEALSDDLSDEPEGNSSAEVRVVAGARVSGGVASGSSASASSDAATGPEDEDDLGEYFDEATADDDFDPEKWRNL